MDEMTWTDPQLKALYERHLKAMEQRRAAHPELFNKWAVPYKVFTRSSLHGIQNMRINEQGDWTGVTQQQADQLVWDNRDEILARASYDSELSTWTLHQLDQLKEPQPAQSLDREAPAQTESTTKRRGPRL